MHPKNRSIHKDNVDDAIKSAQDLEKEAPQILDEEEANCVSAAFGDWLVQPREVLALRPKIPSSFTTSL